MSCANTILMSKFWLLICIKFIIFTQPKFVRYIIISRIDINNIMKCKCVAFKSSQRKIFDLNVNFEWNWHLSVVTHWQKYQKVRCTNGKKTVVLQLISIYCDIYVIVLTWWCLNVLFFSTSVHFVIQKFDFIIYMFFDGVMRRMCETRVYNERRTHEIERKTDTRWVRNWNEITK